MLNCVKRYDNLPFAHRQPNHEGHCHLIHGHNWAFEFEFRAATLDGNGFVIDFGSLGWLKSWLANNFDHTLVLNQDDPMLPDLRDALDPEVPTIHTKELAKIVTVPNCGAEGLAKFVFHEVSGLVLSAASLRVRLVRVTVFEDDRNSATYAP